MRRPDVSATSRNARWRVFLGARDVTRGREAAEALASDEGDVTFVPLDVTSDDSVAIIKMVSNSRCAAATRHRRAARRNREAFAAACRNGWGESPQTRRSSMESLPAAAHSSADRSG